MSCDDDYEPILEPRLPKQSKPEEVYAVLCQAATFAKQIGYILYRQDRRQRSVLDERALQNSFEGLASCLGMCVPHCDMLPLRTERSIMAEEEFEVVGDILYGSEDFSEDDLNKRLYQLGSLIGCFSAKWDEVNVERRKR